jgi:hypothetical protein
MRPIDLVLARAEAFGVKPSGRGRWRMLGACHGAKRTLSVSIAEGHDGAVLLHCFAGCEVQRLLDVLQLQAPDLFPSRDGTPAAGSPGRVRPFSVVDMISALSAELRIVWVMLGDVAAGRQLTPADRRRAGVARERCLALLEELRHVR